MGDLEKNMCETLIDSDTAGNLDLKIKKLKKIVWKFKLSFKSLNCRGYD